MEACECGLCCRGDILYFVFLLCKMFGILSNKSINYVCNTLYTTATAPRYGVQLHQWSRGRSVCGGVRLQACQRRLRSSNGNGKRRRAMGTTPAVRVSWSRTTRHFPRASLYTISAPLLIMSAVSLYNTSRGIGDYFGDNVQQQIENFRTWIHMMVCSYPPTTPTSILKLNMQLF